MFHETEKEDSTMSTLPAKREKSQKVMAKNQSVEITKKKVIYDHSEIYVTGMGEWGYLPQPLSLNCEYILM